jgi:magnesium-transporting ATPase (P-type)
VTQVGLEARGVALGLVCLACVFIILWVAIGAGIHKNYETPTPVRDSPLFLHIFSSMLTYSGQYWCWIGPRFPRERLGGENIWLWITLFASAILYIPLHYWAKGFWSVDEGYNFHWWNPYQRVEFAQRRVALGMLL